MTSANISQSIDMRPVVHVIGNLIAFLGSMMMIPLGMDMYDGSPHWPVFLECGVITIMVGGMMAMATHQSDQGISLQQTLVLTTSVWVVLPVFGALPFVIGATDASPTLAFFEAMSGLTTTGATVFTGLDDLPRSLILWRAILQWMGGVGIIVVAMVFLPELKIGGMQVFRSEGFDTFGKILPRATEIATRITVLYIALTLICALFYLMAGMGVFESGVHAMTTIATGGFSSHDASFAHPSLSGAPEYVAVLFMCLAALPFVRYVQLVNGQAGPLFQDPQIRGFFLTAGMITLVLVLWQWVNSDALNETSFRKSLFNTVSILTGTGYASADYNAWGSFPVVVIFFAGLIGGCAGSTACSVKIFRYQILISAIKTQIRQFLAPSGVFLTKYQGRKIGWDVLGSVLSFFVLFFTTLVMVTLALSLTGLDMITAISGAAAALANIGPGLGAEIGPTGFYGNLNTTALWILTAAMLIGRLELVAVIILFTRRFWRSF